MKLISRVFFGSLGLLLATPFLAIGGLQFPYQTTRIITFCVAIAGLVGATLWRAKEDRNFQEKIVRAASHPAILMYAVFVLWLFLRSIPVFLSESWWGTWLRFDGIFFELAFLTAIVAIAAWACEYEFGVVQKKIFWFLGFVLMYSLVIFPALSLDHSIFVLPEGRFSGSVGNPLFLAGLLLFIPWFVAQFKNRKATIIAAVIAFCFLYATETRGAYLAVAAGLMTFFWESVKISFRAKIAVVTAVFFVIGFGLFAVSTGKISIARNVTIATRLVMWKSGAQELLRQPLIGFGLGEHRNNIDRSSAGLSEVSYGEITDSTHSAYLDIALKGGLVALGLFVVWALVVCRSFAREHQAIARATFVAYLVLIATAPWMVWTTIPLIFMIASAIEHKKSFAAARIVFTAAGIVVVISSVITAAVTTKNATYLSEVSKALSSGRYIHLPTGSLATHKLLPFSKDFMVEFLRLTMPSDVIAIAPSVGSFTDNKARPVMLEIEKRTLHPDALNIAATWASAYATSGLTAAHSEWFERSLKLQQRALAINPERPAAVFQSADSLRELGRISEAVDLLKNFADQHKTLPEAQFYYALMVDISGDTRKAFALEQQIKKDFPQHVWRENMKEWFSDIEARAQKLELSK